MPNLRWLKLNKTGLESLPDELSHLMKLVFQLNLLLYRIISLHDPIVPYSELLLHPSRAFLEYFKSEVELHSL